MRRLIVLTAGVVAGAALVRRVAIPWWHTWGRRPEDDAPLPGDDLVADATAIETRGIDIAAPPEAVWPWLAQMGYGRAGWYSYDALDMNRPSSSDIDPSLAHVDVGDILPTHPGGGFEVRIAEPATCAGRLQRYRARAPAGRGGGGRRRGSESRRTSRPPARSWRTRSRPISPLRGRSSCSRARTARAG